VSKYFPGQKVNIWQYKGERFLKAADFVPPNKEWQLIEGPLKVVK